MSGRRASVAAPVRTAFAAALVGLVALAACGDSPTVDRELEIEGTGVVAGFVFLDVDGTGSPGPLDEPAEGIRVRLVPAGGGGAVTTADTDTLGVFQMTEVPVGGFRLQVDSASVPDSVQVLGLNTDAFLLAAGDTVIRNFRVSFPTYDLAEVRELEPGRRVFTHGIVLNARVPFGDAVVHLREGPTFLRATSVERNDAQPRDSVRYSGRTAMDGGQPVLTDVRVFILQPQAVPPLVPIEMDAAAATSADDGTRDAALVRVRNAVIRDTVRVGEDLVVTAEDESGLVDVVLRGFINWNWSAFRPNEVELTQVTGLLVPITDGTGEITWRMTPRGGSDVSLGVVEEEENGEEPEPEPAAVGAFLSGPTDPEPSSQDRSTEVAEVPLSRMDRSPHGSPSPFPRHP